MQQPRTSSQVILRTRHGRQNVYRRVPSTSVASIQYSIFKTVPDRFERGGSKQRQKISYFKETENRSFPKKVWTGREQRFNTNPSQQRRSQPFARRPRSCIAGQGCKSLVSLLWTDVSREVLAPIPFFSAEYVQTYCLLLRSSPVVNCATKYRHHAKATEGEG
jgi:hypothetical protein